MTSAAHAVDQLDELRSEVPYVNRVFRYHMGLYMSPERATEITEERRWDGDLPPHDADALAEFVLGDGSWLGGALLLWSIRAIASGQPDEFSIGMFDDGRLSIRRPS